MRLNLLISAALISVSALAVAGPQNTATTLRRAATHKVTAPLAAAANTSARWAPMGLKTQKKLAEAGHVDGFTYLSRINRPASSLRAPLRADSYSMPAYGAVVYSSQWYDEDADQTDHTGMYEIPTSGNPTKLHLVKEDYNIAGIAGCVYADGKFFSASAEFDPTSGYITDMTYYVYNTETWEVEREIQGDVNFFAPALTYDPTSERVYGNFVNSEEQRYFFGTLDINTGAVTEIADWQVSHSFSGLAASPSGTLYGQSSDGMFYTIDKRTGQCTLVGSNGIFSDYTTSAAIDTKTGKMYYIATTDSSSDLFEIDTTSGNATLVYTMPGNEQVLGLYIPTPDVAGGAPDVASNVTAVFDNGSLSGTVCFTAPTLNYNNIPGTGEITYTVMLNGTTAATGTSTYGAEVSAAVTAPAPGNYTIAVAFANAAGQGPIATTHAYIGPDQPTRVKNVMLDYDNGSFTLTWDEPSAVNGGFIDQSAVTYRIKRYPDNRVVARAYQGTTFTEPIAEPSTLVKYYYTVAATYEGNTSDEVESNVYALGSFVPPYSNGFDTADSLDDFTIVDANNDGIAWEYVNGEVKITYNSTQAADDYLILPPMKLEAGRTYSLSFDVKAQWSDSVEKVAAYVGTAPTVEALTTELLRPTNVTWDTYTTRETYFVPQTSGTYFFAIKGCSEADRFYLCIDNVYVSDGLNAESPAAPTAFTVTPGANGAYEANISFTAPSTTISGKALTQIEGIEITRNGQSIATIDAAPGASVTYTDNSPVNGNNDYGVAAINAAGKGAEAHCNVFVGVVAPVAVETVTAIRNQRNPGKVNVGWDAVNVDENGNPLSSSQVQYVLFRWMDNNIEVIADGINATSFQDTPCEADATQRFIYYGVQPVTAGGEGEVTTSDLVAVGAPYEIPYFESFANGGSRHIHGIEDDEYSPAEVMGCNDLTIEGVTSQDNDNGFITFYSNWGNASSTIYSGNILIEDAVNPELTFYYYDYETTNQFNVQINAGNGFQTVRTINMGTGTGWTKVAVSLGAYLDMEIQFAIEVKLLTTMSVSFDNFRVGSRLENNLVADAICATPVVNCGDEIKVDVTVKNEGRKKADSYAVELYRDESLVAIREGGPLDADGKETVSFTETATPLFAESIEYFAKVVYTADEHDGDNTTAKAKVEVKLPDHPVATGLKALSGGNDITLTWEEPDFDTVLKQVTVDGAEDYRTFSIGLPESEISGDQIGGWTMVDADGLNTYGIQLNQSSIVQYPNAAAKMAFQVFSVAEAGINNPAWESYSGDKMFVAFASEPDGKQGNDDWMISPLLSGDAQTISFYAKSVTTTYGADNFEVLYSMGGTAIDEFVKIGETVSTTDSWQAFAFQLPEGAKHFAIRCVSFDTFALCIDEIRYIAADADMIELSLLGYNVYRNGTKVNELPVEDQSYTDINVPGGSHTYHVTALYTVGESRPSAPATVEHLGGIDPVAMEQAGIRVHGHTIIVEGAEGSVVAVYAADGRNVYADTATATVNITVEPAIYLVVVGNRSFKVAVK